MITFDMELSEKEKPQTSRWLRRIKEWLFSERVQLTQDEIRYLKAFVAQRQQGNFNDSDSEPRV